MGNVAEVCVTVVEPVNVGAPKVREEQVNVPQVSVFVPIFKSVFSVDPFQQHLNISVLPVALKEFKVTNPPTFCCIPPPRAPPYPPIPIYIYNLEKNYKMLHSHWIELLSFWYYHKRSH